jgi:endonuclease/exonuclease/phosphatase family metal-dependent hydrolase
VYREARIDMKFNTWETMELLGAQHSSPQPWLCVGDFNEILYQYEKEGGMARPQICLDRFKGAMELCALHDLGFAGDVFTWRNKQIRGDTHIHERLDRVVANSEWRVKFPLFYVKNGDPFHSDHKSVVIFLES